MALASRQEYVTMKKNFLWGVSIIVLGYVLYWWKYRNETESAPNWNENNFLMQNF